MQRSMDDPPDGLPPTCVEWEVGRVFNLSLSANVLLVVAGNHDHRSRLVVAEHNGHQPRRVDEKCERCDRPGIRFFDRHWCCEPCGQAVLDRLTEESERPAPQKPAIVPGRRRK